MTKNNFCLFIDDERFPINIGQNNQKSAFELTGNYIYKQLDWVIVRSFGEFVKVIEEKGVPEYISFDHDLKDFHYYHYSTYTVYTGKIDYTIVEGTGFECAKWLIQYLLDNDLDAPEILIHTQNNVGGENIRKEFESYNKSRK
jgi:hypothetical protein